MLGEWGGQSASWPPGGIWARDATACANTQIPAEDMHACPNIELLFIQEKDNMWCGLS